MPMKFGIHYSLSCAPDQSVGQRYRDTIEQAVYAEALGFESVWPVEQHFNQAFSALPCPALLLAAVAARTRSLRLGTGIVQLGINHPLRVAEEMATLDVLSGGRVEFGVGRGGNPNHFAGFGVPLAESRQRMEESLDYIEKAFLGEKFSFKGRFFRGENVCLSPKPEQRLGPPVTIAVNSAETAVFAARKGYPIVVALHINPLPKAQELVSLYREVRRETGHGTAAPISLLLPLFVAERETDVKRVMEPVVAHFVHLVSSELAAGTDRGTDPASQQHLHKLLERLSRITYDSMNESMAVFDTPGGCTERLAQITDKLDVDRIIGWFNLVGAVPPVRLTESLELFARKVMPHFS